MRPRSAPARALADPRYRKRVVRSRKTYTRKGRGAKKASLLSESSVDKPA